MGTIIRTAASIGCERILVTKNSVNPWSPKVLRSAMGAHFHIKIIQQVDTNELRELVKTESLVFADSKENGKSICYRELNRKLDKRKHIFLMIGNETKGINDEMFKFSDPKSTMVVKIPTEKYIESLNCSIAFAVIAFEIRHILTKN